VVVNIYDEKDNLVKTYNFEEMSSGEHEIEWDGTNNSGAEVEDGTYSFEVTASDENENSIDATSYIVGSVTGVSVESGTVVVIVNGREIPIGSVIEINEAG
jgi:flagellar basal-body rod modification protein FlgD